MSACRVMPLPVSVTICLIHTRRSSFGRPKRSTGHYGRTTPPLSLSQNSCPVCVSPRVISAILLLNQTSSPGLAKVRDGASVCRGFYLFSPNVFPTQSHLLVFCWQKSMLLQLFIYSPESVVVRPVRKDRPSEQKRSHIFPLRWTALPPSCLPRLFAPMETKWSGGPTATDRDDDRTKKPDRNAAVTLKERSSSTRFSLRQCIEYSVEPNRLSALSALDCSQPRQ